MVTKNDNQKPITPENIKDQKDSKSKDIKPIDMKPKVPISVVDVEGLEYIEE